MRNGHLIEWPTIQIQPPLGSCYSFVGMSVRQTLDGKITSNERILSDYLQNLAKGMSHCQNNMNIARVNILSLRNRMDEVTLLLPTRQNLPLLIAVGASNRKSSFMSSRGAIRILID